MTHKKLGPEKPIPNKKFPDSKFWEQNYSQLILSEKEKEENDHALIKKLVLQYEEIGRRHIASNREKIIKNQNLANGVIDKNDYLKHHTEYETELTMIGTDNEVEFDLEFYPLIPNIINTLTSFLSKSKIGYSVIAVNSEAQNEILEQKNNQLRNLLVSNAMTFYINDLESKGITEESQPDVFQKQMEMFQAMPKIQKYYSVEYKLSIETWANHRLEMDKKLHNLSAVEKEAFRNKLICDRPYVHVDLQDDKYIVKVLRPENAAYLKSPYVDDVSEGYMFMWYEYDSPISLIQNFGEYMDDEDVEKLKNRFLPTRFTTATYGSVEPETDKPIVADIQNYLAFRTEVENPSKHRGEEYRDNIIETLHMYVQIPRKLIRLTVKDEEGEPFTMIVSEEYKPTYKAQYVKGKKQTLENLVYGEHLEPFYINELWRITKINFSRNPNPDLNYDIWIKLNKFEVQLSNPRISKYGSYIPVHGGPTTNKYSETHQIVDKCKPWQIFYNYIWNRIDQLLETEIGSFLILNQNLLPQESMDGSWGKNNYLKFMLSARDNSIGPIDNSPSNTQSSAAFNTGFGQQIDLTKTKEILGKIEMANVIKNECLAVVGASPQLLGDISPNETATGITQGIQKSISQLKPIYDEHYSTMEKVRQTMLEMAKYLAIKNKGVNETYISDENERIIFQTDAVDFPLYQLGVFCTADFDDNLLLAQFQEMVKYDNTMGADIAEKFSVLSTTSVAEVHSKLKDLQIKKEKQIQAQQQAEASKVQQEIEAKERMVKAQLDWEKEKLLLTLESNENIQEMRVIGAAQLGKGDGVEQLIKYQKSELDTKSYYNDILAKAKENQLRETENANKQETDRQSANSKSDIEREKLQVKREELMARMKISKDQLAIAKENKGQ